MYLALIIVFMSACFESANTELNGLFGVNNNGTVAADSLDENTGDQDSYDVDLENEDGDQDSLDIDEGDFENGDEDSDSLDFDDGDNEGDLDNEDGEQDSLDINFDNEDEFQDSLDIDDNDNDFDGDYENEDGDQDSLDVENEDGSDSIYVYFGFLNDNPKSNNTLMVTSAVIPQNNIMPTISNTKLNK